MAVLNLLAAGIAETIKTPGGIPWEWLILKVFDFVANYGWRIILFTVLLKLVLLPLDIYQKYCMRKNQKITERLKPEMEKLEKAYGDDRQTFAQKQMELNKKEGFSYFSSCLPMILTMVIFIWLWNSMTDISRYMIMKQYVEWYDRYQLVEDYVRDEDYLVRVRQTPKLDADGNPVVDGDGNTVYIDMTDEDGNLVYVYTEDERARIRVIVARAATNYNNDLQAQIVAKDDAIAAKQQQIDDKKQQIQGTDPEDAETQAALAAELATLNSELENLKAERETLEASRIPTTDADGNVDAGVWSYKQDDHPTVVAISQQAVADMYRDEQETNRESFLWVKNIWSPDVPWKKPIGDLNSFKSSVGKYLTDPKKTGIAQGDLNALQDSYTNVTARLRVQENQANGYLILPILSIGFSFLSYFITQRQQKKSGQAPVEGAPGGGTMKFMMYLFPIMMGVFALTYSTAFTLYIVVNSGTTIVVNLLSTLIINLMDRRETGKAAAYVQQYGRPDPNANTTGKKKKEKTGKKMLGK